MMPTSYLQHNPYTQGPGNISEEEAEELQKPKHQENLQLDSIF